ncbi:virulence factor [Trinickia dabaoshanensis]|uniref:Virulence factor n=1 Tax=Trinickia dabaoshanensis TaxID=564714 RepID=A0A2N7VKJ9_9BURK|nr:AcvB/VirJ family lysyl-phosphatidylglycerol hydrolase [Trinickia dabaoshanensis]PMS17682.1 virulence factor [Trinickia dabaoshanensis]
MTLHAVLKSFKWLALFASVSSVCIGAQAAETQISGGRYGDVIVQWPQGEMRGFVVLFSAGKGWTAADSQAAHALAEQGALTVGVDTGRYAANLAAADKACRHLDGDAEAVSHQLERQLKSNRYFAPIMAGTGQGATLALHVLAQAPANTIAGAAAVDAQGKLNADFAQCPPDPTISRGSALPGFVEVGVSKPSAIGAMQAAERSAVKEGADTPGFNFGKNADSMAAPLLAKAPRMFPAATTRADQLVALIKPHLLAETVGEQDVSDLPLVELPAAHPRGMLAIVMSGDGGWRDLDKTIGEQLQKDGVSVVGWDSLRYFWSEKSPEQVSRDLSRVLRAYGARWHATSFALIGYSFGADVMPFAYNLLPATLRNQVSIVSLLGFAPAADFQVRVTGWLGMPASDKALQAKPAMDRLPAGLVQCFYGENETDTLCPALTATQEVIRTPGGHHFDHGYDVLERRILTGWEKRMHGDGGTHASQ